MTVRTKRLLAAAVGLWVGGAAVAKDPAKPVAAPAANQTVADAIAAKLTASATADGADVSVSTQDGVVTVQGRCKSDAQKQAILADIRTVKGVKLVRDGITVGGPVVQAQGVGPLAAPPAFGMMPGAGNPVVEPMPLGGGTGMAGADLHAPPLPNHAWPTYAPYPNVSRVGYPTAYPYNAFPFIGPYYPFPKVPLGWRSVKLEWEDGHWWMGRTAAPQDYWRVRFW